MPPEDHHINAEGYITIEKITASAVEEFYEAKEPGRRRAQINAPDRIDFWADAESGVGLHAASSRTRVGQGSGAREFGQVLAAARLHHDLGAPSRHIGVFAQRFGIDVQPTAPRADLAFEFELQSGFADVPARVAVRSGLRGSLLRLPYPSLQTTACR